MDHFPRSVLLPRLLLLALLAVLPAWARPLSVSELNYHPLNSSDYEFIELINSGTTPFDLTGCRFTASVTYTFGALTLQPGERTVICRDRSKFASVYGNVANLAPGAYSGKFSDSGEQVTFVTPGGAILFTFKFDSGGDWPSRADGLGSSLECIDPNGDLSDPLNWRSSTEYLGSPGRAGVGGQRTLVINEILAHTDPPQEDAIELLNLTDQPIDISGWYISNARSTPKKYKIPAGTVVPKNSYYVFYQYQFDAASPKPGDTPFTFNSAHGDEGVVTSADAAGNIKLWIDAVSFDATPHGFSVGRYPNGSGKVVILSSVTLGTSITAADPPEKIIEFRTGQGAPNAYPRVGPVVFNRIMYHPPSGGDEFLELMNSTDNPTPLYDPVNPANTWHLDEKVGFSFPQNILLDPHEKFYVVPIQPANFRTKYNIPSNIRIFGPYTNKLNDGGEKVQLFRPDPPQEPPHPDAGFVPYILVEQVSYLPTAPWPVEADGTGAALLRKDPAQYADDPAAWTVDTAPPAKAPPMHAAWDGTTLTLSWAGVAGVPLVLEDRPEATDGTWGKVADEPAPGTDGTQSVQITPSLDRRYYRLRIP